MEAFWENYPRGNSELKIKHHFMGWAPVAGDSGGSILSHFIGGAVWGESAQDAWEAWTKVKTTFTTGASPTPAIMDTRQDNAAAYLGNKFFDWIDGMSESDCRIVARLMAAGKVKFTDIIGSETSWNDVREGKTSEDDFANQQFAAIKKLFGF